MTIINTILLIFITLFIIYALEKISSTMRDNKSN